MVSRRPRIKLRIKQLDGVSSLGFIPRKNLDGDYFIFNEALHSYVGRQTRKTYQMGNRVKVMVTNADPIICSIGFSLVKEKSTRKKFQPKPKKDEPLKEAKPFKKTPAYKKRKPKTT